MTEAVAAVTNLAFEKLQVKRITICCDATNDKSRKIPEHLGYELEAKTTGLQRSYYDQKLVEHLLFVKLAKNE